MRHPASGLVIVTCAHKAIPGESFSELRTGLGHLSFAIRDRVEWEAWQTCFAAEDVTHSPIYESPTVRIFRDPDNIQREMYLPALPPF